MPPAHGRLADGFALAHALHRQGRLADAERLYDQILRADPRNADALHARGLIALQMGQPDRGVALIETALKLKPRYPEALANLGLGYSDLKRHRDALVAYDKALKLNPKMAAVHDNRGTALRALGRPKEALTSHDKAIALDPGDAGAHSNRGNVLRDLGRNEDALASYGRAVALQPDFVEARCNRAIVLHAIGRDQEALAELDTVVAATPAYPEGHYERGNVLLHLRRNEEALGSFDRAIALRPGYAEAYNSKGSALRALRREADALEYYARAIALAPDDAAPYFNSGNALVALGQEQAALAWFERALALKPDDAATFHYRGLAHLGLRQYEAAIADFGRAFSLDPDIPWLLGDELAARRQICDWSTERLNLALDRINAGHGAVPPFVLFGMIGDPALHRRAAGILMQDLYPPEDTALPVYSDHQTLRIGYFSADFRDHAMMHVMTDLFRAHDRSRFEITAFSFGADTGDAWRDRVRQAFDRFIDVRTMADTDVVTLARGMEIDIAVDLMGYTQNCRPGLFARRVAPVQVSYLGFPGTMAAPYIDYLVADPVVIPPETRGHYTEAIAYLPDSYQANSRSHTMSAQVPTRAEQRLPEDGVVFCCFNNSYKIAPAMFDSWMRILHAVPTSVLWLYQENDAAVTNLLAAAASRGIAAERLVFAARAPLPEHLARQQLADLFLDTQPYTGHATASLALWAGVPVLTILGNAFPGRVAASLLRAVGLPELIVATEDEYETLAIALARDPARLRVLRDQLLANRDSAPLFDTARFARHLEAAFEAMQARARAGQPPADITVPALRDPETIRR